MCNKNGPPQTTMPLKLTNLQFCSLNLNLRNRHFLFLVLICLKMVKYSSSCLVWMPIIDIPTCLSLRRAKATNYISESHFVLRKLRNFTPWELHRLCLFIRSPTLPATSAIRSVLACICCCVCDSSAMSSAKSRSSNCVNKVHWIPVLPCALVFFIIQSMANKNMNGDSKHPCLTPVCIWKLSVSFVHVLPYRSFPHMSLLLGLLSFLVHHSVWEVFREYSYPHYQMLSQNH